MINEKRILEIKDLIGKIDKDKRVSEVASRYQILPSSAERYIRIAKVWDEPKSKPPKILLLDIETAPILGFTWTLGKVHLHHYNVVLPWYIISWSGKWLLEDGVFGDCITRKEARSSLVALIDGREHREVDKRICRSLWKVIEEANWVIAHNGDRFDIKKMNTRFIINDIPPYSSIQSIDTLKYIWKSFAHSSHKLDYLTKRHGLPQKAETDYDLWKKCYFGDQVSLDYMYAYNKSDIEALEALYLLYRPWFKGHPNMGIFYIEKGTVCPFCGCKDLDWKINNFYTPVGMEYESCRCVECNGISHKRFTKTQHEERKTLIKSIAR